MSGLNVAGYDMNPQEMADVIMKKIKEAQSKLTRLNLMVLGKTGVGKSTLINNVFSQPVADVGVGKPVTDKIRKYEKEGYPLAIYDTPGLELSGENAIEQLIDGVKKTVTEKLKTGELGEAIHCIWYCVSTPSHRFEETEKEFLTKLSSELEYKMPIVVVLTQSYSKSDAKVLKAEIEKENLPIAQIVPILSGDYEIDEDYVAKAYGLDKLTDVTESLIPEGVKNTLAAVQKVNIRMKQTKAQLVVATSAAAAAATGAIPIPFSDAIVLVPEQIAMLASITAAFGLPVGKSAITAIVSATIGTSGATVLGKTIVTGLLKCIPGAGSVIGGVISGSVAAALTAALGEAYIGVLTMVLKGEMKSEDLDTKQGKEMISKLFKEKLKLKRSKNGEPLES